MEKNNYQKNKFLIETKINSFIKKNNGNCYIFFYKKKELINLYTKKVIKTMIKDTIKISNEKEEEEIKVNKKNIYLFDINEYKDSERYIKEIFEIEDFPIMIKIKKNKLMNIFQEFIYVDKI